MNKIGRARGFALMELALQCKLHAAIMASYLLVARHSKHWP